MAIVAPGTAADNTVARSLRTTVLAVRVLLPQSTRILGGLAASRLTPGIVMKDPTVRGVVHLIEDTKTFGQKGFRKRLVVLEQSKGTFTNYIPVDFLKEACDEVDGLSVGDEIEVTYRLSGRRWQRDEASEAKYFLSAEALSFRQLSGGKSPDRGGFSGVDPNDALAEAAQDDVPF